MVPSYLIPEGMRYFVAGGFAVCPALASDIDVWFMVEGKPVTEVINKLVAHLTRWQTMGAIDVDFSYINGRVYHELHGTLNVATIAASDDRKAMHIMVTDDSPQDTIDDFDLSVCQVAITDNGEVYRGEHWTAPGAPIKILKKSAKYDPRTAERLTKYIRRFGQPGTAYGVPTSIVEVVDKHDKHESLMQRAKRYFAGR